VPNAVAETERSGEVTQIEDYLKTETFEQRGCIDRLKAENAALKALLDPARLAEVTAQVFIQADNADALKITAELEEMFKEYVETGKVIPGVPYEGVK
jgi:hypothetical protein